LQQHAYKIFTIDKVIGSFIKQVQIIIGDSKSQDLLDNLKRDRATGVMGTQDMLSSQQNAEKLLGPDENLFRINLVCFTLSRNSGVTHVCYVALFNEGSYRPALGE